MRAITSPHNEKLKQIRKLRQRKRWRERSGQFVAEGEDLLKAADDAGWIAAERFCAARSGLAGVEVEPEILASLSGLASGTRALAVYNDRWAEQPLGPLCVYLHGIHDPGNVGAILRSAQAFGASCVAIGPETADPFGPKAVRASMGAVFWVPLARIPLARRAAGEPASWEGLPGETIALVPGAGLPLAERLAELCQSRTQGIDEIDKVRGEEPAGVLPGAAGSPGGEGRPITLLIGSERGGLPADLVARADHVAQIPIRTHSLNAAMAATVALYELGRRMPPR